MYWQKGMRHQGRQKIIIIALWALTLLNPTPAMAVMPSRSFVLKEFFSLFRFINPRLLKVHENLDRDRTYEAVWVCPGAEKLLPQTCYKDSDCKGTVDMCHRFTSDVVSSREAHGNCVIPKPNGPNGPPAPPGTEGKCDYDFMPKLIRDIKSTDFSNTKKAFSPIQDTTAGQNYSSSLVYPKLQNEKEKYDSIGNENAVSWGAQNLLLDNCSRTIRQLSVVIKAKQTKATVHETNQWPLGWVDWEYETPNGKTLIEINDELPDNISSAGMTIVEASDTFYTTVGHTVKDTTSKQTEVCNAWIQGIRDSAIWATDLAQSPIYPVSIRQGYSRGSICVNDQCCPGDLCRAGPEAETGNANSLYTDASIHSAFAAALDDLFIYHSYTEALEIYKKIVFRNQLVRWVLVATPNATPQEIRKKLEEEMGNKGGFIDKLPKDLGFKLYWLGHIYDYQRLMDVYGYELQPTLDKQAGGAFYESPVAAGINLLYGVLVNVVETITPHLITIPDIMGQTIYELQEAVYNTRDNSVDLSDKYNETISNIVDDSTPDSLYAGKALGPGDAKRRLAYFTCNDPYFSDQKMTTIEMYAYGTRVGCNAGLDSKQSLCDGTKFATIIKNSLWKEPLSSAKQVILNSSMFVGGKLNPKLEEAYSKASEATGVPCEIIAGHHFEEASDTFTSGGDPTTVSAANGGPASQDGGFEKSVMIAAEAIKSRPYYDKDYQSLITAISNFNGGGNSNCSNSTPYQGCPKKFDGEDDPYAMNLIDEKHKEMYLVYCGDGTKCNPPKPYGSDRPGAFAVALVVHEFIK